MFGLGRGKTKASDAEIPAGPDEGMGGESAPVYLRSPSEALQPETVPHLPELMRKERSGVFLFFNGIISLLLFCLIAAGAAFLVVRMQFDAPGPLAQTRAVVIPQGEPVSGIASRLEREGVISDSFIFMAGVWVSKAAGDLKAGEFLFKEQASMRSVMATLVEGKALLHKVTIPEGWTSEQIVARLMEEELLSGEVSAIPAEGALLPDTYKFTRGESRGVILERMRKAQQQVLARVWSRRDKNIPVTSPQELVILASIVEKETGRADERPRVAAVFANRLKKSMRLQSDPTIIYGLVGGKGPLGRSILKSEIDQSTPYNTYQIDGLPPTPIANPGVAALEATANPSRTEDLYFVADGNGGHLFAPTLREHNKNVVRWRQLEKAMQEAAEIEKAKIEKANSESAPVETRAQTRGVPKFDLRVPGR